MLLTKWVEKVGYMLEASDTHDVIILAKSPAHLEKFVMEKFDPKTHDMALGVRFRSSMYVLFIDNHADCPMNNVRDPSTGRFLIKYGEIVEDEKCLLEII